MRTVILPKPNFISLLLAFNMIGRRMFGSEWNGQEAAAVRLGQKHKACAQARERGFLALKAMRIAADNGALPIIYTNDDRQRVPYFDNVNYWITALHPDPIGSGEGMIELDGRYLYPVIVDVSGLGKWCVATTRGKTGPRSKYHQFKEIIEEFFRIHPTSQTNSAAWNYAGEKLKGEKALPGRSWGNDLIDRARERQQNLNAIR